MHLFQEKNKSCNLRVIYRCMRQKKTDQQLACFLTLTSFSLLPILYPAGRLCPLLLFPLIPIIFFLLPGRNLFLKKTVCPVYAITVLLVCFFILKIKNSAQLACGVPLDCVTSITGRAVYDSSFTQTKNNLITLYINEVETIYGQTISAKGLVNVLSDDRAIITCGVKIKYIGKFSGEFFKGTNFQVTSRSIINDIREFFISEIEKRILVKTDDAAILSSLLLLGRAEDSNNTIKQEAAACGCTHVLALSGMHLNTFTLFFKPIKNKSVNYVCSVVASLIFVFIAGPRPSLVRALLMLIFRFLPIEERMFVCYIVQLVILPFSIINTGCIYSYLAIFAITFLAPVFNQNFPKLKAINTSSCVVFLIAPIELITTQCWYPIAILLGPIAGLFIAISMFLGLLLLFFVQLGFLNLANNYVYTILENLFTRFSSLPNCGWKSYLIFASCFSFVLLYIPLKKHLLRHRFKKVYKNPIMKL